MQVGSTLDSRVEFRTYARTHRVWNSRAPTPMGPTAIPNPGGERGAYIL